MLSHACFLLPFATRWWFRNQITCEIPGNMSDNDLLVYNRADDDYGNYDGEGKAPQTAKEVIVWFLAIEAQFA